MKERQIKAAFFDIDGTLLSHKLKEIPQSARNAVAALRSRGVKCLAASGRHILEIAQLPMGDLSFDGYITLNGQLCIDSKAESFFANPITGEALDAVVDSFRSKTIPIMLIERDAMYLNFINENVRKAQAAISTPVAPLGEYLGKAIYQAIAYLAEGEESALADKLPGCLLSRWNQNALDVISNTGGKEAGIQAYLDKMAFSREETIAFGDGINDIQMLKLAGIGVCMGNGHPLAKEAADYVTADLEDDGIEKALKHFCLI